MKIVRAYPPNYAELRAIFPITGRHERRRAVAQLAARLASPLYGGMVSAKQAREMLKQ